MRTQLKMILMMVAAVTINLCYYWHSVHQFCHWVWDSIRTMSTFHPFQFMDMDIKAKKKINAQEKKYF